MLTPPRRVILGQRDHRQNRKQKETTRLITTRTSPAYLVFIQCLSQHKIDEWRYLKNVNTINLNLQK